MTVAVVDVDGQDGPDRSQWQFRLNTEHTICAWVIDARPK